MQQTFQQHIVYLIRLYVEFYSFIGERTFKLYLQNGKASLKSRVFRMFLSSDDHLPKRRKPACLQKKKIYIKKNIFNRAHFIVQVNFYVHQLFFLVTSQSIFTIVLISNALQLQLFFILVLLFSKRRYFP